MRMLITSLLGSLAFHVSSGLIHVVLAIGIVMLLLSFFRGRSATSLKDQSARRRVSLFEDHEYDSHSISQGLFAFAAQHNAESRTT